MIYALFLITEVMIKMLMVFSVKVVGIIGTFLVMSIVILLVGRLLGLLSLTYEQIFSGFMIGQIFFNFWVTFTLGQMMAKIATLPTL